MKIKIIVSTLIGLVILIPMIMEVPHEAGIFIIFVLPIAFFTVYFVLNVWEIKQPLMRKISTVVVALAFVGQFSYSLIFINYTLLKAFSYSMVGTGATAFCFLAINYLMEITQEKKR